MSVYFLFRSCLYFHTFSFLLAVIYSDDCSDQISDDDPIFSFLLAVIYSEDCSDLISDDDPINSLNGTYVIRPYGTSNASIPVTVKSTPMGYGQYVPCSEHF